MTAIGKHAGGLATDQANDANAVFEHAGVYHLMFQTDCTKDDAQSGGICVGGKVGGHAFSHLVSTDGAHWRRLPDALIPMNTSSYDGADGDCDGTVSFPEGIGPTIMWGADCGRGKWPPPDATSERSRAGDYPRVAVAFAVNASDLFLERWKKSENNPVEWATPSNPCSFPGRVWHSAANGTHPRHWNMVCTGASSGLHGTSQGPWYRMSTMDPTLHGPWVTADAEFARSENGKAFGSISSPSFYALPAPQPGEPTHILNGGNQGGLLHTAYFNEATEKLENVSTKTYLMGGGWSVAGKSERDDSILYFGQHGMNNPDSEPENPTPTLNTYTMVRVISYERATQGLVINPLSSYAELRNGSLSQSSAAAPLGLQLLPSVLHTPALPPHTGTALDLEVTLALPHGSSQTLAFELQVLASPEGAQLNRTANLEINGSVVGVNVSCMVG